jgi:hypothetical protein
MTSEMNVERAEIGIVRFLPLLAGVVAVALWTAGYFLMESVRPGDGATAQDILAFYQEHGETVNWAAYLTMLGSLPFLMFVATLCNRLREAEGSGGPLAPIAFAAGIVTAIGQLAVYGSDLDAALDSVKYPLLASTAEAYYYFGDHWFVGAMLMAALMLAATGLIVLRTGTLPRWLGWASLILAVPLLLPPVGSAVVFFGFPAWIVVTALFLTRRPVWHK